MYLRVWERERENSTWNSLWLVYDCLIAGSTLYLYEHHHLKESIIIYQRSCSHLLWLWVYSATSIPRLCDWVRRSVRALWELVMREREGLTLRVRVSFHVFNMNCKSFFSIPTLLMASRERTHCEGKVYPVLWTLICKSFNSI